MDLITDENRKLVRNLENLTPRENYIVELSNNTELILKYKKMDGENIIFEEPMFIRRKTLDKNGKSLEEFGIWKHPTENYEKGMSVFSKDRFNRGSNLGNGEYHIFSRDSGDLSYAESFPRDLHLGNNQEEDLRYEESNKLHDYPNEMLDETLQKKLERLQRLEETDKVSMRKGLPQEMSDTIKSFLGGKRRRTRKFKRSRRSRKSRKHRKSKRKFK